MCAQDVGRVVLARCANELTSDRVDCPPNTLSKQTCKEIRIEHDTEQDNASHARSDHASKRSSLVWIKTSCKFTPTSLIRHNTHSTSHRADWVSIKQTVLIISTGWSVAIERSCSGRKANLITTNTADHSIWVRTRRSMNACMQSRCEHNANTHPRPNIERGTSVDMVCSAID